MVVQMNAILKPEFAKIVETTQPVIVVNHVKMVTKVIPAMVFHVDLLQEVIAIVTIVVLQRVRAIKATANVK